MLLGVLLAQGTIGYIQYFTGVPVLLVGFHILGAVLVWIAVVWFYLGLVERPPIEAPTAVADDGALAAA